jgi:hypothetical protein
MVMGRAEYMLRRWMIGSSTPCVAPQSTIDRPPHSVSSIYLRWRGRSLNANMENQKLSNL